MLRRYACGSISAKNPLDQLHAYAVIMRDRAVRGVTERSERRPSMPFAALAP
jgi:hypothetical protein